MIQVLVPVSVLISVKSLVVKFLLLKSVEFNAQPYRESTLIHTNLLFICWVLLGVTFSSQNEFNFIAVMHCTVFCCEGAVRQCTATQTGCSMNGL